MKQEQENVEVSHETPSPQKPAPARTAKLAVNDYEPYITPYILYQAVRYIAITVFHLVSRLRVRGLHNVPTSGAFIIASNHLSWTDIPLVVMHLRRRVVYMAKEEYFKSRIRWLVRLLGSFPVRRGEADRQALRTAEEQLKKGNILVIFPEGTRSRSQTMAHAHSGMGLIALRTGVPVVPVAISGSEKALKKFRTPITITYGQPIVLKPAGSKITREDIDQATQTIMRKIAEMLPQEYRGVYGE